MTKGKIERLKNLRNKIIDKIFKEKEEEVWFFPKREQIQGFWGTKDIMFVGLNPSFSHFPTNANKFFFYVQLANYGFENAHLTDLIKIRLTGDEIKEKKKNKEFKKLVEEQKKFLKEEIGIIKPKIIVALGNDCEKLLRELFPNIKYLHHYSWVNSYGKKRQKKNQFAKDMRKIVAEYKKCKK